jgi:hypothetical protein
MISIIKHKDINKEKWDSCISLSPNGLVYACSWYLDIVCPDWDALILDDYKAVMPLTAKIKFGLKYLFQPGFTQQLGVFSADIIEEKQLSLFLEAIFEEYKLIEINLNYSNNFKPENFQCKERINYELQLNQSYNEIYSNYTASNKDSLKRAYKKDALEIRPDLTISELIGLFKNNVPIKVRNMNIQVLKDIHTEAVSRGICELFGLYNNENKLVAASSFILYKERLLFFTSISSEEGKRKRAMFQMLDYIIKKYTENNFILDFEGSNIPGIARFFAGFGPKPTTYLGIRSNRLPALLNFPQHLYRKLRS